MTLQKIGGYSGPIYIFEFVQKLIISLTNHEFFHLFNSNERKVLQYVERVGRDHQTKS